MPVFGPDIIEIQPCTEEGLVTLEARLGGKDEREFLDPALLCRYLNASPVFTRPRCSAEMGYGVAERLGRNIHAFKTGKVIVRRAEGNEQALENLQLVSRTIWPALKVRGGEALVVCLASENGCTAFPAPPADGGELRTGRPFPAALDAARELPQWKRIEEGLGLLRAVANAYPASGVSKATREQFRKAEGPFVGFLCEVMETRTAAVGIAFLSASLALDRSMQECEKLPPEAKAAVWGLAQDALEAVMCADGVKAGNLKAAIQAGCQRTGADVTSLLSLVRLAGVRLP